MARPLMVTLDALTIRPALPRLALVPLQLDLNDRVVAVR